MRKLANLYLVYHYAWDKKQHSHVRKEDPDGYLFSHGQYKTKIRAEDLPEWYVYGYYYKCHGYLSAKGVKHLVYRPNKCWNHMFKDDFLFISYDKSITHTTDSILDYTGHDEHIYGGFIVKFLKAAEKYSGYDISEIKAQIEDKRLWFKENYPGDYAHEVPQDKPFFD